MSDPKTLARTNDPQTSKDAAKRMVDSGELNHQEEYIYDEIVGFVTRRQSFHLPDDFTTKDIARRMEDTAMSYDKAYEICRRRFSGLFNKFKICLTGDRRDGCRVWRLL
jgi:hypothetical protein